MGAKGSFSPRETRLTPRQHQLLYGYSPVAPWYYRHSNGLGLCIIAAVLTGLLIVAARVMGLD